EGIEDVVSNGENGFLVKPKDYLELKEVLARLFNDEELRHNIGKNAESMIKSNFTLSKVVKQLIDLYDSVLNRNGGN
ncbi:glycosyltransferase, partial [Microvirga sp. 3-52]|nr:glycosyltransferase [Microvirga sp. 3-52]